MLLLLRSRDHNAVSSNASRQLSDKVYTLQQVSSEARLCREAWRSHLHLRKKCT